MKNRNLLPQSYLKIIVLLLIFFSGCTNSSIKQKTNSEEITQPIVSEIEKANYRHLLLFNFNDSEEDLAVYIAHPDHKAYGKILHPQLEDFLVLDYWVKN